MKRDGFALAVVVFSVACGGGGNNTAAPTPPAPTATTIVVTPTTLDLIVGAQGGLSAVVRDASGNIMPQAVVTWASQLPSIASVAGSGTVTGVAVGTTSVTATSGSAAGLAVVTVRQQPAALSLTITPGNAATSVGGTAGFTVVARDANGVVQPTPAITQWTTSAPSIATVSSGGLASGVAPGTTLIGATAGSVVATPAVLVVTPLTLTVLPGTTATSVGGTVPFTVEARDVNGVVRPTPAITGWTSSAPAIATVSSGGVATGVAPGTTTIGATAGSLVAVPATLTVGSAPASCAAIASKATWDVTIDLTWTYAGTSSQNNLLTTDHGFTLVSTLTNRGGVDEVQWTGPIDGTARVNDSESAAGPPPTKSTIKGGGSIVTNVAGNPLPGMELVVDMLTCRYRIQVAPWLRMTLVTSTSTEQADNPVGILRIGWLDVYDKKGKIAAGFSDVSFDAHRAAWLAFPGKFDLDAYFPAAFGPLAFRGVPSASEPPAGSALVTMVIR